MSTFTLCAHFATAPHGCGLSNASGCRWCVDQARNTMQDTTLFEMAAVVPDHPAEYTESLYPVMARSLVGCTPILDPFAGKGGVFKLAAFLPGVQIEAVEIQPEWAAADPRITLGNALYLPWADHYFGAICVSPTYGNRMADKLQRTGKWAGTDVTYTSKIGHALEPDNSGALQWGDKYRAFHVKAWAESDRVLRPSGVFVLNCKNHIRDGAEQKVTEWHVETLKALGYTVTAWIHVPCPGMRWGANSQARVAYESVVTLRKRLTAI